MQLEIQPKTLAVLRQIDELDTLGAEIGTEQGIFTRLYMGEVEGDRWFLDITALVRAEVVA